MYSPSLPCRWGISTVGGVEVHLGERGLVHLPPGGEEPPALLDRVGDQLEGEQLPGGGDLQQDSGQWAGEGTISPPHYPGSPHTTCGSRNHLCPEL